MATSPNISRRTAFKYALAAIATAANPTFRIWPSENSSPFTPLWRWADLAEAGVAPASTTVLTTLSSSTTPRSNFRTVYGDQLARDRFYLFLQNVYHLYPESQFHQLIIDLTNESSSDQLIYLTLQPTLHQAIHPPTSWSADN
ncbi:MAG: hypothetical protein HY042_09090 [Spirochaetia bacterium]|nr:hypothetical protein [Spirochaetia bacterium]